MSQSLNSDRELDGFCQWFVAQYAVGLAHAFQAMVDRVAADLTAAGQLTVSVAQHQLHPHTCRTLLNGIHGWSESSEGSAQLQQRMLNSRVDHVKWVAAVLLNDSAASLALMNLITGKVSQQILKQFQGRPHARAAVEDLPSRLFLRGKTGEPRISGFRGESSLDTWLVGIGIRLAINERNGRGARSISPDPDRPGPPEPFAPAVSAPDDEVAHIMRRLALAVIATVSTLSDQEIVVFKLVYILGRKPSEASRILTVSRPRISQVLLSIRHKIAVYAEGVILEVAEAANVDETVIVELLAGFLANMKLAESEPNSTPLDWKHDALDCYLRERLGLASDSQSIEQAVQQ